jgi:predicted Zn-dependent peptidase
MKRIYLTLFALLLGGLVNAQELDRSKMPEPGPAPEIDLGETESFTLDNGLKVFVVENNKLPRVAYSMVLDLDPIKEGDKVGAADLAGDLMMKGTKNRTKDEINFEVDFIGARLSTSSSSVYGASLKKHQEKLLELMSDVIKNAEFNEEELDKLKKQYLSGIQTEKDDPDAIANKVRRVLLYGKDHPYGEIMTEETIENITLADAKAYYNTYFKPNVAYLAVVGDINAKEAKPLIEKYFGDWKKGEVPTHDFEAPAQPKMMQVAFVNKPGAVQSVISVFNTADLKPGSEDAIPARVTNGILGGGFISKLNLNLREENAYTYGARSTLSSDELIGYFNASAKVRNEVTDSALTETIKELKAMLDGEITEDELKTIKNYQTGTFSYSLENPQTKARFALNTERYNLPDDYYATYLKRLSEVSLDDVNRIAKEYIKPQNGYMLVVGNQEEVAEKIKQFSPTGEIMFLDTYGNEVEETTTKSAPEGVTAESVINKYLDAIGGKKNLEKVKSMQVEMSTNMQGMDISIESYNGENGEYLSEVKGNGMTFQKQVYDGEKGKLSGMQGAKEMDEEQLENMKYESLIFPELYYLDEGYELELKGADQLDGTEVYVLKVTKPNGQTQTNYYGVDNGYLLKSESTLETPQGAFTQTSIMGDYKKVGKIIYPHKIDQSTGPQTMNIKVEEVKVNPKLDKDLFKVD